MYHSQNEDARVMPPRVLAALRFLNHTRCVTEQVDSAIPTRPLSPLEVSVEQAALRTLQAYFLGEMDYGDAPPTLVRRDDDPGGSPVSERQPV